MSWPTRLSAADPRRAHSDEELRLRKQTRSTAVHKARIEWGGRKQTVDLKDQTVFDSEFMGDDADAVVWAQVPNRFGHYVHLVKTRRSQVEVIETRGAGNQPLTLNSSGGKFSVWQPNGAILRILRIWNRVEWLDAPPGEQEPAPEVVVRRLEVKQDPKRPTVDLREAVAAASQGLKGGDPVKDFHAVVYPASKDIKVEASKRGGTLRFSLPDSRSALDFFKMWLRDDEDWFTREDVADLMPRSAIKDAVRELARNRWAATPDIVHMATSNKVSWTDAHYPAFAQRISNDRKEPNGWHRQLLEEGIQLHESQFHIRGPGGAMVRVKHYRYEA